MESQINIYNDNIKNIYASSEYVNGLFKQYDIVLLDPPFATDFGEQAIEKIFEYKRYKKRTNKT